MILGLVTTLTGKTGVVISGYADGIGTAVSFRTPYGLTRDSKGTMFVADNGNHVVRKISSTGK